MVHEDCPTCHRMTQFHRDCLSSIIKLKQRTRVARAACDGMLIESLVETVMLLEYEAADLLRAIERHRQHEHQG
jgi:hypothetical protein